MSQASPAEVRKIIARIRRHIPIPTGTAMPSTVTDRDRFEHEAAHIVVALASGAEPLLVHIGETFGGVPSFGRGPDGLFMVYGPITASLALAGMVQNGHNWIGPADGMMLLKVLRAEIGPWPSRKPRLVNRAISRAKKDVAEILKTHRSAVDALADTLGKRGTMLDPIEIRRVARKASHALPERSMADCWRVGLAWRKAILGPEEKTGAERWILNLCGLGEVLHLARAERDKIAT